MRTSGEDFAAGELLIPAGHRLRPADLAAAATAGHTTLEVTRRPVAAIIPTGDEIRPVGSALGPGDVTDSNSLLLASRATEAGAWPAVSDVQPDDPDAIAAEIRRAALTADIVLVIAGSSAGRSDHTAAVVARTGGLAVRGVAVRPGHPVLLGYVQPDRARASERVKAVPVIGIPGYPLAAAVIFEVFAVPLLAALLGQRAAGRAGQRAQLACDWASSPDVEDWVPVSLAPAPGQPSGCPGRGYARQERRRVDQPSDAGPCLVADSHRAREVRTRRAHRRPADTRRTPVTGADQGSADQPRANCWIFAAVSSSGFPRPTATPRM